MMALLLPAIPAPGLIWVFLMGVGTGVFAIMLLCLVAFLYLLAIAVRLPDSQEEL